MIDFIVVAITIMLCWLLGESDCHFWQPEESENVAIPDLENLKHLQNPGNLLLTEASTYQLALLVEFRKKSFWICFAHRVW